LSLRFVSWGSGTTNLHDLREILKLFYFQSLPPQKNIETVVHFVGGI